MLTNEGNWLRKGQESAPVADDDTLDGLHGQLCETKIQHKSQNNALFRGFKRDKRVAERKAGGQRKTRAERTGKRKSGVAHGPPAHLAKTREKI